MTSFALGYGVGCCYNLVKALLASMIKNKSIFLTFALAGMLSVASCNSDTVYDSEPLDFGGVAVTGFSLQSDKAVLNNLDSVFFSIDLMDARIFNANPLPYGTDVSSLAVTVTSDACSELKLIQSAPEGEVAKEINYLTSPGEKIDFSKGPVRLRIVSTNGKNTRDYVVNVNVNKAVADSLYWAQVDVTDLPTSFSTLKDQKTVKFKDKAYCLTTDGSGYCMAVSDNPFDNIWSKHAVNFPSGVDVRTLTPCETHLFILTSGGNLLWSNDGLSWNDTGDRWVSITAPYVDILLGVRELEGAYYHAFFPDRNCPLQEISDDFPVAGNAGAVVFDSKWSSSSQVITMGGRNAAGDLLDGTWAFDGHNWAKLSDRLPAGEGYAIADYMVSETDTVTWRVKKSQVILAIGGRTSKASSTREVYISRDYGINWKKAYDELQLPKYIPDMAYADLLVFDKRLSLEEVRSMRPAGWMELPVRIPLTDAPESRAIKPITSWDCPYLYLCGGSRDGDLQPRIWRGVINQFTMRPLQ